MIVMKILFAVFFLFILIDNCQAIDDSFFLEETKTIVTKISNQNDIDSLFSTLSSCSNQQILDSCVSLDPAPLGTCLDVWEKCIRKSDFFKKNSFKFPLNSAITLTKKYTLANPLKYGNSPSELLQGINYLTFISYIQRKIMKTAYTQFLPSIEFYNQMYNGYQNCINERIDSNTTTSPCGTNALICMEEIKQCVFSKAPFFRTFSMLQPLSTLFDGTSYLTPYTLVSPSCSSNCEPTDLKNYANYRFVVFYYNLMSYNLETLSIEKKDKSLTDWVYVTLGICILLLVVILVYSVIYLFRKR